MEFKIEKDKGVVKVKIVEDFIETATATCFFENTPEWNFFYQFSYHTISFW